jgi:hypothetical protein
MLVIALYVKRYSESPMKRSRLVVECDVDLGLWPRSASAVG